jgi:predicted Fe-Mo cluster-binding NifX family protein
MIITIPTNDRETIAQKSGQAKEFAFFDLNNLDSVVFEENPHKHHEHNHETGHPEHSHSDMIDMFKNKSAESLIVDVIGKHFKADLKGAEISLYKTDLKNLKEIATKFQKDQSYFSKVEL